MMHVAAQYKWTQVTDSCQLCRPSQEVLDAVEGNLEDQEKVCCAELTACMSLFPDRPLLG